jgi:hypothetical protein
MILLLCFFITSCGKQEKQESTATPATTAQQKPDNKELIAKTDSIIAKYAKSHKVDENRYADFHNFLKDFNNASLSYTEEINADLTGQGAKDLLSNAISFTGHGALIESAIYSGKEPVYKDRLRINPVFKKETGFCESLEMYTALLPYSVLFEAYRMRVQAEDTPFGKKTFETARKEFLASKKQALEQLHLEAGAIAKQVEEYQNYLSPYKGKFICKLATSEPDTYFFDLKTKKFELFSSFK